MSAAQPPEVLVVPTGTANTASVLAALARAGARARIADEPGAIARASHVVLPGVGTFAAAVRRLDALELRNVLRRRIEDGRATLGLCVGLQVWCAASEESPGVPGLALVPETVRRFPPRVRVPQLGWNRVEPRDSELLEPGEAYFANGYRLADIPPGWGGAHSEHGGRFASALERGALLGCQFHPELSGAWGARLLARWIERGRERG